MLTVPTNKNRDLRSFWMGDSKNFPSIWINGIGFFYDAENGKLAWINRPLGDDDANYAFPR